MASIKYNRERFSARQLISALFIGISSWFMTHGLFYRTVKVTVPLNFVGPNNLIKQEFVTIRLRGPLEELRNYLMQGGSANIKSASEFKGLQEISITGENLGLPSSIQLVESVQVPVFIS